MSVLFCIIIIFKQSLIYHRSNGFSGTIAGAILGEPNDLFSSSSANRVTENIPMPFVVSAKSLQALRQYLIDYLEFCRKALLSKTCATQAA